MAGLLFLVVATLLVTGPTQVSAEIAIEPPSASAIPFDDDNPASLQAELAEQTTSFLQRLDAHWGNNADPIRAGVPGKIGRDDANQLVYARALAGHVVLEGYEFLDGSLVRGRYFVLQRPLNRVNEFIEYFDALKQTLTITYGQPAQDHMIWENDLYQPVPEYWGVAVMIGYLRYAATWPTPNGTIMMELRGDRHSMLTLEYRSTRFIESERVAAVQPESFDLLETPGLFCQSTIVRRRIVCPRS